MLIRYPSRDAKFCLDIQVGMLGKLTSGYIHLGVTSLWSIGSNIKENKGSRGYREAKKNRQCQGERSHLEEVLLRC